LRKQHEKSRNEAAFSVLNRSVALPFYRYAVVLDVGMSAFTGTKYDVNGVSLDLWHIAFVEFFFVSHFYYLEAFLDEVGRELPQLFKVAVAVKDSRKVLFGVVGGNSEVIRHNVFSSAVYAAIRLMVLLA